VPPARRRRRRYPTAALPFSSFGCFARAWRWMRGARASREKDGAGRSSAGDGDGHRCGGGSALPFLFPPPLSASSPRTGAPDGVSAFALGGVLPFRPWWRRAPTALVLLPHASNGCSWESRGTSTAKDGGALFRLAEALPVSTLFFSPFPLFNFGLGYLCSEVGFFGVTTNSILSFLPERI
jgi:hypothetical protein